MQARGKRYTCPEKKVHKNDIYSSFWGLCNQRHSVQACVVVPLVAASWVLVPPSFFFYFIRFIRLLLSRGLKETSDIFRTTARPG